MPVFYNPFFKFSDNPSSYYDFYPFFKFINHYFITDKESRLQPTNKRYFMFLHRAL